MLAVAHWFQPAASSWPSAVRCPSWCTLMKWNLILSWTGKRKHCKLVASKPDCSHNCSLGHSKCIIIWRFYPFANIKFLITPRHCHRARQIQRGEGFWESSSSFMGTGAVKQLIKGQMSAISYTYRYACICMYIYIYIHIKALLFRSCCWQKGKGFGFTVLSAAILSRLSKIDATVCWLSWTEGCRGVVHRKLSRSLLHLALNCEAQGAPRAEPSDEAQVGQNSCKLTNGKLSSIEAMTMQQMHVYSNID